MYKRNTTAECLKAYILPFPDEGLLGIAKNYSRITLTDIVTYVLLLNRIRREVKKILRKNQNDFRMNRFTTSPILTIRRIIEGVRAKNFEATLLCVNFFKAFKPIWGSKYFKDMIFTKKLLPLLWCSTNTWKQLFTHSILSLISLKLSLESCKDIQ